MIELNNCDLHDNVLIDKAVVLASGSTVSVSEVSDSKVTDSEVTDSNSKTPENTPTKTPRKKAKPMRVVQDVFRYRWLDRQDGQLRLLQLYQKLIHESCGWLDPSTSPDTWCALFMGKPQAFTMKWLGTQAHLRYLFKLMLDRGYIEHLNKGVGRWEILGSHFLDSKSKPFTDWDSQKDPKRYEGVVSALADLVK